MAGSTKRKDIDRKAGELYW